MGGEKGVKYFLKATPLVEGDPIPMKWEEATELIIADNNEYPVIIDNSFVIININGKHWLINRKELVRVAKSL
jgi:hypothetical protein